MLALCLKFHAFIVFLGLFHEHTCSQVYLREAQPWAGDSRREVKKIKKLKNDLKTMHKKFQHTSHPAPTSQVSPITTSHTQTRHHHTYIMKILLAASDIGGLKEIVCTRGTDTSLQSAPQPEALETFCVEKRDTHILHIRLYQDRYVVTTRLGGVVDIYDLQNAYELVRKYDNLGLVSGERFISLVVPKTGDAYCYACTDRGQVFAINLEDLDTQPDALQLPIKYVEGKKEISCFAQHPTEKDVFLFGGKEIDLHVTKLDRKAKKFSIVFKAKNVSTNRIQLREPIWISKAEFVSDSTDSFEMLTVTRQGQMRYYDTSKGKKPRASYKISADAIVAMSLLDTEKKQVICSDTHRTTARFDYSRGLMEGKYTGSVGSTGAISVFRKSNLLVAGGLDRYIRCYEIGSRECLVKVYVGTEIADVVILSDERGKKRGEREQSSGQKEKEESRNNKGDESNADENNADESDIDSDDDAIWHRLESNLVSARKKRRLELS